MLSHSGTALGFSSTNMTLANFKARIYGFINRASTVFTTTESASIDQVLYALNDARKSAQREHSFEMLRGDAFLSTSEIGANWQTGCKTTPGGATARLMKRVDSIYNFSTSTITAGTLYARTSKIDFGHVSDFKRELPVDGGTVFASQTASSSLLARRKFAYMNGATLHVTTVDTAANVMLNGITFLDDLADGNDPDVFLTYFPDWLHWATLIQLNQFLKDDQRINIDASFVGRLWQSVKEMDGQIANSGDNVSLD